MKDKKIAAYSTVGIGVFVVLILLLCPPEIWAKVGATGMSSGAAISKTFRSWDVGGRERVVTAARPANTRPQNYSTRKRPACFRWHTVQRGQTQWFLATAYSQQKDKQQWLRSMRWISRKYQGDTKLSVGESVCVRWASTS
ncbi:hypothetical protein [Leucothrix arctica]|uniref:LysM domain-containing protein n=1 Tax=Leucothrix arctica TaxID=1481894 RepID=A0A317CEN3_9GAMM|nr:hypothetical protein [Leucothrix arctica]PWQ94572.1 hypothetical protein DKT75_14850 [Leucothrix arctica]